MGSKTIRNIQKIFKATSGVLFGRKTAGTGRGEELTPSDVRTMLSVSTTSETATLLAAKADLVGGLVPAGQLPSYVDDVIEAANLAAFPVTGESGKIYVALDTSRTYRWSGSAYVELTDSTAVWGSISGTLSNQTDLNTALSGKALSSHAHGNITNSGAIGSTSSLPIITGTSGVLQAGSFGSSAGTFCQGNDSRLSDSRTPTAHTHPQSEVTNLTTDLAAKQVTLVSGTNIKTVSGNTLLGSGDVPLDMLATLAASEISVTGAVTATISRMHVCSGTSADYTVALPAASGNAGKLIGFRMASGLTKLVTLDGNASETIDGLTTRVMWAGESAILLCDGSNWFKISGKSIPLEAVCEGRSATTISNQTTTRIDMTHTIRQSVSTLVDLTNDRITVPRPGVWIISGLVSYQLVGASLAGNESYGMFGVNGTIQPSLPTMLTVVPISYAAAGTFNGSHCALSVTRLLAANDFIVLLGYQSSGSTFTTRTVDVVRPYLSLLEVPSW